MQSPTQSLAGSMTEPPVYFAEIHDLQREIHSHLGVSLQNSATL